VRATIVATTSGGAMTTMPTTTTTTTSTSALQPGTKVRAATPIGYGVRHDCTQSVLVVGPRSATIYAGPYHLGGRTLALAGVRRERFGRTVTLIRDNGWTEAIDVETRRRDSVSYRVPDGTGKPRPRGSAIGSADGLREADLAGLVVVIALFVVLSVLYIGYLSVRQYRRMSAARQLEAELVAAGLPTGTDIPTRAELLRQPAVDQIARDRQVG
jgi:hypothetical protein